MGRMIAMLKGEVVYVENDEIIVMVGGVGFKVAVPASLCGETKLHDEIHLHTHLVVREDALSLYGFASEREKTYFLLLLGANGVGPRTALGIISMLNIEAIRSAVLQENVDVFARVPGVGRKTAQKIILQLTGKVGSASALDTASGLNNVDNEVVEALISLGYSVVEAQAALQSIPKAAPEDVESRLRLALQYFSQ